MTALAIVLDRGTPRNVAFASESGIRKHHNVRAFLLSVFVPASASDDPGVKQLAAPARAGLNLVP